MPRCLRLLAAGFLVILSTASVTGQEYDHAALAKWRADKETTLKQDNSWLTVAGLHFLSPGENRLGRDATNDIVLDFPDVPGEAAVVVLQDRKVSIRALAGRTIQVNGQQVNEAELKLAGGGKPADLVTFGRVIFFAHYSGPRLALRVRNLDSPIRTGFTGLKWFDADPAVRVSARYTPYPDAKVIEIPNILGDLEPFTAVGTVSFSLGGQDHTMEAWRSGQRMWFVFRDLTSGRESYPSARFLYAPMPAAGPFTLDFNYAENPPCAYNPYTTCPLPPPQNRLKVRIAAGEKTYQPAAKTSSASPR
ncbi:MAG: DUF1684 domain-containing protein [Vicinamibacterales bacterium]